MPYHERSASLADIQAGRGRLHPSTSAVFLSLMIAVASRYNECLAFSITSSNPMIQSHSSSFANRPLHRATSTSLHLSSSSPPPPKSKPPPLPKTTDPFLLLGLSPTTDPKEIKSAYRKRAMQYHPDVILSQDSSQSERQMASDDFAKINAAYEMLSGGGKGAAAAGGDSKYDAGGDSFGSIFSDLLTGVASGVAGSAVSGGGIIGDFIDFLEGNIDGFASGYDDDKSLSQLLSYGSFDEVASEMDETDVLVTSLEKKLSTVENEKMQVQADLAMATKYSEKLDLEERIAELKAREKVVKGYLKKGRSRLVQLRERYKELMVQGRGGRGYDSGRTSSGRSNERSATASGTSSSSSSSYYLSRAPSSPSPTPTPSPPTSSSSSSGSTGSSSSWRNEGFSGSYGGRSSSGRRSSRRRSGAGSSDTDETPTREEPTQQPKESVYGSSSSTSVRSNESSGTTTEPWTPPHRRTSSSAERVAEEKRRLRELQVDDEFEALKREMGM
ncbi:predicted protein [Thalassiosira pseudonana CCMP1335]|uniref:J domain-containing protein n=1 Tax=Thalassiosira pseudonana TaxID=35128 RepID=B8BTS6_THAPS|nr:predicted protein [Thalassiosira pseudonana CCMP1335]EED94650.1 predicted protein [Thalassiosira pseudonana CCMP1335]